MGAKLGAKRKRTTKRPANSTHNKSSLTPCLLLRAHLHARHKQDTPLHRSQVLCRSIWTDIFKASFELKM